MFPGLPAGRQPPLSRSWGERRFSTPRRFLLHLRFIHPWPLFGREVSATFWVRRIGFRPLPLGDPTAAFWRDFSFRA